MSHDIGKSVRRRLASRTAVTNLVGANIFAGVADQGAVPPLVIVQVQANTAEEDLTGTSRIFPSSVVVLAYGNDRDQANEIALQIRDDALPPNLSGEIEGVKWQEVTMIDGPTEIEQEPRDASDNWKRITSQTFVIWNATV